MNNKVWLKYFQENENASDSFINEMHNQLIYEFDRLMGKKLNWNKIWLFVEPVEGVLWYEKDSDNKLIGILDCFLSYGKYDIETQIIWYSDKRDKDISVSSDFKKGDLHFEIRKFLAEDWKIRHFPEYNYDIKKNQLSLDLNFPVYCVNKEAFVHEGYFIIKIDKEYLDKVKEFVNLFVSKWNRKNNNGDLISTNGFIHTIEFLKWEKNKKSAVFYIDSGSAKTQWFYDFLKGLDSLQIKTKSVEILGAEEVDYL